MHIFHICMDLMDLTLVRGLGGGVNWWNWFKKNFILCEGVEPNLSLVEPAMINLIIETFAFILLSPVSDLLSMFLCGQKYLNMLVKILWPFFKKLYSFNRGNKISWLQSPSKFSENEDFKIKEKFFFFLRIFSKNSRKIMNWEKVEH